MNPAVETQSPIPYIDHPSKAGWLQTATLLSPTSESLVRERFDNTSEDTTRLLGALGLGCMMTVMYRHIRELENKQQLAVGVSESQVSESYDNLAGDLSQTGPYVRWFGRAAAAALDGRGPGNRFNSISLELGGMQQNGDWDCTAELDAMVDTLPRRIVQADGNMVVTKIPKSGRRVGYVLMPQFIDGGREVNYAVLRRRRAVADIMSAETPHKVEIFKQSYGLVVIGELEPHAQRQINDAAATYGTVWTNLRTNNPIANTAGHAFEEAIRSRDRSGVTTVVPISAQYLMRMRIAQCNQSPEAPNQASTQQS